MLTIQAMNTHNQVRLDAFRRLGTKVRLTNSLEAAITTKLNQRTLFLTLMFLLSQQGDEE